ncbi:MAG: glycine cleavage system aminomethyltransferase GcvT [Spirochaetes bacterium]|nr:glycine cleavage system aminomethyltransferase GcvT [Spirochaetota bacterium]
MNAQKTFLYEDHIKLGGKMVEFAGWELPVMYSSIIEEHMAVRQSAGLFDVSHMGEIVVKGRGARAALQRLIPTDMGRLEKGKSMYTCFLNEQGGVIDDLFIFMLSDNEYYLVVNAATTQKDVQWLLQNCKTNVSIQDVSAATAKIDLQGPQSYNILKKIIKDDRLEGLARFYFFTGTYKGEPVLISQTGYTGEFGYELFCINNVASRLWNDLLDAGKEYGIKPVGLGARDTLRLEASYSLYGYELSETISPVEGGIGFVVSAQAEYIAKDIVEKQKTSGAPRQIICLEMLDKAIPRSEYRVLHNNEDIGYITSGGFSPLFKKGIAMALVKSGLVSVGDEVAIVIRDKTSPAKVVQRPFYKYTGKKL